MTSFIISDNVQFVTEVWDNMHNWMDNPKKRKAAIKMLKEFKSITHNQYWLTDDEELFIDQLTHTIESCC